MKRLLLVVALALLGFAALPAGPAAAHPLGNFSVNRYAGLTLYPNRVDATVVADVAELPTLQDPPASCAEAVAGLAASVGGTALRWTVEDSSLVFAAGAGGLRTSRLQCRLSAPAGLGTTAAVSVANRFRDDRIGWRELTAAGSGVRITGSPVPTASVSDELRHYPDDLLASPLNVRSATFTAMPGAGTAPTADVEASSGAGPLGLTGPLAGAERWLENTVGRKQITPLVGLLAVLLALVLGAAHAALPGHGKTVMAAYLAGRGRTRDAVAVGATVTLTHTGGVLLLGLLLTTVAGVAGEAVLGWLGVASGTLVAAIGVAALVAAVRRKKRHQHEHDHHEHHHGHHHHGHEHHGHDHDGHDHHHDHGPGKWGIAGMGIAGGLVPSPSALIVLLGAAALGRTVFGVLLVLAYGVGMAGTLTAAGLLLIRLRDRHAGRFRFVARWRSVGPPAAAALIVLVGLGLAGRALSGMA
jgi:nickel/cobalt exporter